MAPPRVSTDYADCTDCTNYTNFLDRRDRSFLLIPVLLFSCLFLLGVGAVLFGGHDGEDEAVGLVHGVAADGGEVGDGAVDVGVDDAFDG